MSNYNYKSGFAKWLTEITNSHSYIFVDDYEVHADEFRLDALNHYDELLQFAISSPLSEAAFDILALAIDLAHGKPSSKPKEFLESLAHESMMAATRRWARRTLILRKSCDYLQNVIKG